MADKDYNYVVLSSTLTPFSATKENMDITRLIYDFSCYVEPSEVITQIDFPTIAPIINSGQNGSWQVDYPFPDNGVTTTAPVDTYPMSVLDEAITTNSTTVEIKVIAGTPGFSYVLSFLVTGSTTHRRKQVDTIVNIENLTNPAMAGPGDIGPDSMTPPLIITDSVSLPMGFTGLVLFNNSAGLNGCVITMPPNPNAGDMIEFIDVLGQDGAHPVTFRADSDGLMDADGSQYFVSTINYDVLRWQWTGNNWHLQSWRYGFLG